MANTERHEHDLEIDPNISFAKEKRVYPEFIKNFQESRAKALAEQASLVEIFSPEVRAELIAKVGDQEAMAELNSIIKGFLASKQDGLSVIA